MPLDARIAGLLQLIEAGGYPPLAEGTPEQARAGIRALMTLVVTNGVEVAAVEDGTVAGGIPVRVYRPAADTPVPTVVYLHGGGFVIGDLETHDGVCRLLCRDTNAVIVSVDYRLAPEHHFPVAVEDAYAALQYVAEHIDDYGGDAERLAIGGDSAGGNLSAVCAQRARDDGLALKAQLLVYPAVDMFGEYPSRDENATGYFLTLDDMRWFAEHYLGTTEEAARAGGLEFEPRLSPLHAKTLEGLPPAVVVTAEYDPLRDEGNRYAAELEEAGVPVRHKQFAGLIHGFYGLESVSPAVADAAAWTNAAFKELLD